MRQTLRTTRGFTLVELMVSMGVGLVLMGSALLLYVQATKATFTTSERSEMQQDFRAASNILQRDISMAGAGSLGQQGLAAYSIGLPTGAGSIVPVYPCSTTTCNYANNVAVAYPTVAGAPYLFSIIPGNNLGITVNATEGPTDIITVAYADARLPLNCYAADVISSTQVLFELPINLAANSCVLPPGLANPPGLMDAGVGLQQGDLILFGQTAVGVVSNVGAGGVTNPALYSTAFTVNFNAGDVGNINQPAVVVGSMKQLALGTGLSAVRLQVITYYLDISPIDGVTPRLMRIQSGRAPAPVAENVAFLKFSYDVDNNGIITPNLATLPAGVTPNMITKVNILHMSIRSQLNGVGGYQGLDLQTSICARNLTMGQEYPLSGTGY